MESRRAKPIDAFRRQTARRLRTNSTDAEQRLWRALRRLPLSGSHFRRQVPIGDYVADFACLATRLVIEIDGSQHAAAENAARDTTRTAWLEAQGYRVLRFWNNEITNNMDGVLSVIHEAVHGSAESEGRVLIHERWRRGRRTPQAFTPPRRATSSRADPPPPGEGN